jgi:membrane protease YdiL (CAAX protease family)
MKDDPGPRRRTVTESARLLWRVYKVEVPQPLYCLLFLFPLVATYEFGTLLLRPVAWPERQLVAQSLVQKLLSWFGAGGMWLPGVALLLTLLIWHILARHSWRVRIWMLPLMALESIVLTMPLFVLGQVMALQAGQGSADSALALRGQVVLALGAGIYEELVFRLYLIAGLSRLLESGLRVARRVSVPLVVALSAGLFALCHFAPIGSATFDGRHFVQLVLAGVYLAIVFLWRGLGIAAGCHAAFNLTLVWLALGARAA